MDVNYPGSQGDVVSNWSLLTVLWKMPSLGLGLQQPLAFQLWLSQVCLSAPGVGRGKGPVCSQLALLWYSLNLVFCELESFIETFSFLFFSSLVIPQFGLLSHVSSLRLSTGHSGPVLTLSTDDASCTSLPSPRSLVADASVWANSPLAVEIRRVVYVAVVAFFFTSWLCCPPIF